MMLAGLLTEGIRYDGLRIGDRFDEVWAVRVCLNRTNLLPKTCEPFANASVRRNVISFLRGAQAQEWLAGSIQQAIAIR